MSSPPDSSSMTVSDRDEFEVLEGIIDNGLKTFIDVGNAMLAIRDRRLYRAEFPTFEAYCESRWEMSGRRARQIIDSAQNAVAVGIDNPLVDSANGQSGTMFPKNTPSSHTSERAVRPLSELSTTHEKREAWTAATKEAKAKGKTTPSAKGVKAAVEKVKAARVAPSPPPATQPTAADVPAFVPFNDELDAINDQLDAAADHLTRLCGFSEKQQHAETQWAQHISWQATIKPIRGVITHLKNMRPAEVDGSKIGFIRAESVKLRSKVAESVR